MPDSHPVANDFLSQLTALVEQNIANEQFGVAELADEMHMSRSNLLRKVKKETNLSVSQLISQVRLKRGMELLQNASFNVSEVSHQVGFNSTSYFIKCFREYYGYPPGEVGKIEATETNEATEPNSVPAPMASGTRKRNFFMPAVVVLLIASVAGLLIYSKLPSSQPTPLEKSIAVLPFKNDSNDSTNVYLINGLMESTLNNLQKIKDLKVISRTSAEKYRNTSKSISEMAQELNVNYFVEGSGQKIGDRILLNIQLIEASSDRHLWAKQYRKESKDIFELQREIANSIAEEIRAVITLEEKKRIAKDPTDDLVAYDLFLKGRDLLSKGGTKNLEEAISYFKKAIEQDKKFALAYANATMAYYYLDAFQTEKKYSVEISSYADNSLLYDPKLAESLIAKAMFYMDKKKYGSAVPHLEKALEYNPSSILVINFLADFYCNYSPNTTRYLEYALKGVRLDMASQDSVTTSYNYLRLSNALMQTGFVDESLKYINKSLDYNPDNPFSGYVKAFILLAKSRDCKQTKELLIKELNKDTTRLDILQDVGKICYLMKDYEDAYHYYKKFIALRENKQLDIYQHENLRIAIVLTKVGLQEQAEAFVKSYKEFADHDRSIYKHLFLSEYYAYRGDIPKAMEEVKLFSKEDNYQYWILLWDMDTGVDGLRDLPEFRKVMREIESKFWKNHQELRVTLKEKGLL